MTNFVTVLKNQTIINCINCELLTVEKTTDYLKASITMFVRNGILFHKSCRNCRPDKFNGIRCKNCRSDKLYTKNEQHEHDELLQYLNEHEHDELQYLNLIANIIRNGNIKTNTPGALGALGAAGAISDISKTTYSLFGERLKFNLRKSFPLLTTKQVFWRAVVEELLWFIKGSTNTNHLSNKNINIWNENGSRKYLDSKKFTNREQGDLGPVYGFQWRHSGALYETMNTDYKNKGIDQLKQIIETIKTNPNDRRMIMCSWVPIDIPKMALPPCHCLVQFYVANGELSCQLYQRSADVGLGVPFNIASYSLLTYMIAHITDLKPGDFIHILGDAHIYENHLDALKEQLLRRPFDFPTLKINNDKKDIDSFVFDDLILENYKYHPKIELKLIT